MPPFFSISKAVGSKLLRGNGTAQLIRSVNGPGAGNSRKCIPIRYLGRLTGIDRYSGNGVIYPTEDLFDSLGHVRNSHYQRRHFLGCGDGEEGSALAKVYEEKRIIGYSPEQLFAVVAAVDLYEDFLPWCQRSDIVRRHPDGSFDAELEIGFKFLVESYLSHVVLNRPKSIKTTSSQSNLFEHLINIWEFHPGPTPETCNLYFLVDFKFRSPLYRQVASMFFREVVSRLVGSFNDRCRLIYGPSAPIVERYN